MPSSIPAPQPNTTYVDVDNQVYVNMKTNGSVAGLDLVCQITNSSDDVLVKEKTITIIDPGSTTTKAILSFTISPDLDDLPVLAVGQGYKYYVYVRTGGRRAVFARGPLSVQKRIAS